MFPFLRKFPAKLFIYSMLPLFCGDYTAVLLDLDLLLCNLYPVTCDLTQYTFLFSATGSWTACPARGFTPDFARANGTNGTTTSSREAK